MTSEITSKSFMKKIAITLVIALSAFTRVYAEPFDVPGNPKHPAFMDAQKSIELNYRSHIFEAIDNVKCGDDEKGLPEKMLKVIEEHPEEVNDVFFQDGIAITALMAGIAMNNTEVVKAMLDKGAIPFPYRGVDIIGAVLFIHGNIEIKPEIIEMIRKEQRKYELNRIILESKN